MNPGHDENPSPDGEIIIDIDIAPVSQQSRASAKQEFTEKINRITKAYKHMLSGDVDVCVDWFVSERLRYETDRSPDVDNILKPLIDALVGQDGLLIDDNQVQRVSCQWLDSADEEERLAITLKYRPDEFVLKDGLCFVQLGGGLCVAMHSGIPALSQEAIIRSYQTSLASRQHFLALGVSYSEANMLMPTQRIFHRTRLNRYPVIGIEELRKGR